CSAFQFLSFFFQAEDGIRDFHVTGVQTCALPILSGLPLEGSLPFRALAGLPRRLPCISITLSLCWYYSAYAYIRQPLAPISHLRSEERRVGKECRSRYP